MTEYVRIDARFRGPPASGNGGYSCGVVGRLFDGPSEVTLRGMPPLDEDLNVVRSEGMIRVCRGTDIIAEGRPAEVSLEVPGGITYEDALEAVVRYVGFQAHAFPGCFVCGPERAEGDGLRIFPGAVRERNVVAAPWTPDGSLTQDGVIPPELVWSALDCPSWFGYSAFEQSRLALLGRLAVRIDALPKPGDRCVVLGWSLGADGRKITTASALVSDGDVLAIGRATWIVPKDPSVFATK